MTSYIDSAQSGSKRTDDLEEFGVDCYCSTCKIDSTATTSEKRRQRLEDIRLDLKAYGGRRNERISYDLVPNHPKEALAVAEEAVTLLREEGLVGMPIAKAYRQVSKYSLHLGLVDKAKAYAIKELEVERYCLGMETEYMKEPGNAASWMKQVEFTVEKDKVKIRMCEKRGVKEKKKADKKAAKKAAKR